MGTYLDRILEHHREMAASDGRSWADLADEARSLGPARGFRAALTGQDSLAVISEVKRRSPSKGELRPDLDPAVLAATYQRAGASCVSVLTDADFFGGSAADLRAAREACSVPVLRKDFTVCELDVVDTRMMGADCVLLIVAALDPIQVVDLHQLAVDVGLDVLVEVHDEPELDTALSAGASLVGVNQRDLVTFEVDHRRAVRMAAAIPEDVTSVAESGVRDAADAASLKRAGYDAILVGESLVTASDPAAVLSSLRC